MVDSIVASVRLIRYGNIIPGAAFAIQMRRAGRQLNPCSIIVGSS
jgi:hypothetical protein